MPVERSLAPADRAARRLPPPSLVRALLALHLAVLAASCGGDAPEANAAPGAAGGRGAGPTVVLAAGDVATVGRATLEEGTPITGDLLPIERVEVRARIEGDLVGVYVRAGDRVARGQLLARFEASEQESDRRSAEADRVAAESDLANAQWNLEQARELFTAGAIPERDVKTAEQAMATARARLAAAEARLRATSSLASDTRVTAPTAGIVERRDVENGERVARGAALFTIVRNDVLELAAAVPSRRAAGVVPGQLVHFTADGREFDGRVARVSPTIDPATRAITVYVQVPNASGAIKGNTSTTGRIIGRTVADVLAVPAAAVRQPQDSTGSSYVYRIANDVLDVAEVRLGAVDERRGLVQVVSGLREGDRIVVGNVGTLGKGMAVQVAGAGSE
ncbi:MAG TPA: efflux RND transporter periplasmic adaptor subunit [Gemmatimonadaceae bacterium]